MGSLAAIVFQRFESGAEERRYSRELRTRQAKFTRALMILGPSMLALYTVLNPVFLSWESATGMLIASAVMLPMMAFYFWYVGRPGFAANRWFDLAFFLAIEPPMFFFIRSLWESGISGWPFYAILCYNQQLLLSYACLAFAASVRQFAIFAAISVAYLVATLAILGYPTNVAVYTATFYAPFAILLVYINWAIDDKARLLFDAGVKLDAEKRKSDALLYNVLPQSIATRLQSGEAIADAFDEVTIVFVDVVGFTTLSQSLPAARIVELLNSFFGLADRSCDLFGLEKVKTIGDAYMAVAGAIVPVPHAAKSTIGFGRHLIEGVREMARGSGVDFAVRVGINSGPVIGGVISSKRMSYDYWGDAINVAARIEGVAPVNGITVSQSTRDLLADSYAFSPPRLVALKGIGEVPVYDLRMDRLD